APGAVRAYACRAGSSGAPAQSHIERTLSAMMPCGRCPGADDAPERRRGEPAWHCTAQDTFAGGLPALAGDDQHMALAGCVGAMQETQQRAVRVSLGHAMKVDARLDGELAFGNAAMGGAVQ